jgi:uncharacterized protein (DUF1330 family)
MRRTTASGLANKLEKHNLTRSMTEYLESRPREDMSMSAYVVVETTVRDQEARDRYAPQAAVMIKRLGGEVLASGKWELLFGEAAYQNGLLLRFPDKEAALAWYNSPDYQALLDIRGVALDCRFRLLG